MVNTRQLEHLEELKVGELEWRASFDSLSEKAQEELVRDSADELVEEYKLCVNTFRDIFDRVGRAPSGNLDVLVSQPINLERREPTGVSTLAKLTVDQYRKHDFKSVTTNFFTVTPDNKHHLIASETFAPPTEVSDSDSNMPFNRFNFLDDEYDWIKPTDTVERFKERFLRIRDLILPVIFQAEDTQEVLKLAVENPVLNPEHMFRKHGNQRS